MGIFIQFYDIYKNFFRMERDNREYSNGEITVYWRPAKCIHATTCYRELIEVFNPRKRPWVNMEGAPTGRIIEIVDKCPTEALTYKWADEAKNLTHPPKSKTDKKNGSDNKLADKVRPVTLQVMRDGPLVVQGSFEVFDSKGDKLKTMAMVSFCRCGASNNAPFCDGYHRKIGFSAE